MAVYIGLTVGPPLGGFIVDAFGWRWIFLINIPIGIAVLLLGWFMLPRTEGVKGPRLDVAGSVLLGAFLVCLLVPLTFSLSGAGLRRSPWACWPSRRRRSSRS